MYRKAFVGTGQDSCCWLEKSFAYYIYKCYYHIEGHKGSSFCGSPAKKLQHLRPAPSKVIILRLRHHQESQVVTYINPKL